MRLNTSARGLKTDRVLERRIWEKSVMIWFKNGTTGWEMERKSRFAELSAKRLDYPKDSYARTIGRRAGEKTILQRSGQYGKRNWTGGERELQPNGPLSCLYESLNYPLEKRPARRQSSLSPGSDDEGRMSHRLP